MGRRDEAGGRDPEEAWGEAMTDDDVKLVTCSDCGREMLGDSYRHLPTDRLKELMDATRHGLIGGRIDGRPYCSSCLKVSAAGVSGIAIERVRSEIWRKDGSHPDQSMR